MAFSLFSTPQPQQTPQPFFQTQTQGSPFLSQPQSQQSPFQQQSSLFNIPQPQSQPPPLLQQQQQQQLPQTQQQLYLFTNEKAPASYSTKWADLHPDSQKTLLLIEERILEYRDESQRLDQCSRLYDSSVSIEGFELDSSRIIQELGGISSAMERQKTVLHDLMGVAKQMLRDTEVAIRSFIMLRPRFVHPKSSGAPGATQPSHAPGTSLPASNAQNPVTSVVSVSEFYHGVPKKPSVFLQNTIARFEMYLSECRQKIEELEQLLVLDLDNNSSHYASLLESLPKVMANAHGFFVHVAAKVENIHQYIESMRAAYLVDRRNRGDVNNPFLEADRRETAKQEAAAKRTHPTQHLPMNLQPSTQTAGLVASSSSPAASNIQQSTPAASSGAGFSLFNTPSSTPSFSPSLFATPTPSAPASSLFGQSAPSTQPSLFGSSSGSLFGSASTPNLFGGSNPSLGSTPSTGGALFSTPFASGAAIASGSSFGAASKSSRPKSRTARR